ncbi:hypothetical protein LEP1GSC064_0987 [Leptospira kirschneri serovar Grippotyphosa str. Moskva]|nr:hypothetical protein LEP1GSC064_0987 [Leptospira kirschneri serovar Grippotyphosa str. Moskva]EKR08810.1 hypothetical protein LEP1GSC122_1328 [Leptospira kirschneri serovar Valbuzzi str. 200702274]EMK07988.1 hypothetical protein LEP1GSC176_2654 [Leptospira kirschneri str. MMD1493]EMK18632.1 hypothetical protein LEP1GSC042_1128 [Leptospira kirschneri serovar Bim str. PUO 1247]EMN05288.1 hypothetical protein LEP1GSC046_1498 [Leptospira kirschneri serovar Bim str. 1051]EMO82652.1 hypothetical 
MDKPKFCGSSHIEYGRSNRLYIDTYFIKIQFLKKLQT